ncbi:hypothetical protein NF091_27140 (plasmid) [Escherichia coli]|uniref:hypothetical protein n=1 Tax=Escherichia coli TaxID=562 RepID=UPI0019A68E4A|nr:hypothetical protein [Escherichia coli]EKY0338148.1 hypothetical protein [Escherichia coli O2:H6]MED9553426.1 hypothetical protein [Escherichia marmotae]EFI6282358.1 hypothetical protein [Escherichia coli]EGF1601663.1 hypothetical protein [Escherichia coli]EIR8518000.1 hypothetical protein [Escherichia coli]
MKDITLKFRDREEYDSFLESISWHDNEELQNNILLDVVGITYTEISNGENEEPTVIKNDGFFVNVRILNNSLKQQMFDCFEVQLEQPLREWA